MRCSDQEIDETLYSRQLYVLGHDAMKLMASSDILISGLGGLGVEIAKNVILAGVKSVTLHDDSDCKISDLSSQFFLREVDIGKNRAKASCSHLAELNTYVLTRVYTGALTGEVLTNFDIVVLTNSSFEEQLRISDITHKNNIPLIIADSRGVFSQVFCDFGEEFTVVDKDGESPVSVMVAGITRETEGVVACLDDSKHGLQDGDFVTFTEVEGMTELNGCNPMKIKVLSLDTFSIGDTSKFSPYLRGGIFHQVKLPVVIKFKALRESMLKPEFVITDFAKLDHPSQLHLAFRAMHQFVQSTSELPRPWNKDDAERFLTTCQTVNKDWEKLPSIDEKLMQLFAKTCRGNLNPMNAIIGGMVAQEVMKACSGKFNPIYQWLYFDAVECIPPAEVEECECNLQNKRYDGQIVIFGNNFQIKLGLLKYFVVGAGAIGCELLKNFAMMGIGSNGGSITVTDMDLIEKSNLNRQFLFRSRHVKKSKSITAARAVKKMNPDVCIIAHEHRVGQDTENIYGDSFYENLDGVANALDNLEARIYMDRQCVYYRKPLIESGTLGTKGNIQVIVPFLTESYSSSRDPPEKSIPICTLKSFPNAIEHTIQWARDIFEFFFYDSIISASMYLKRSSRFEELLQQPGVQPVEILDGVQRALMDDRPKNFEDCVAWARKQWQELFYNQIRQLLISFPPNQNTTSGQLFWSGPKRCPIPLVFCAENELHLDFIYTGANLKALSYGIHQNRNRCIVYDLVKKVAVPDFSPRLMAVELIESFSTAKRSRNMDTSNFVKMKSELPSPTFFKEVVVKPLNFEKDDDNNLHIDFVVAASNLRATNYQIPLADRHKTKLIAGKIIPAIATTTSVVAGLGCLELLKLAAGTKELNLFKNGFINLALPFFGFAEPIASKKQKYYDNEWTIWDRFEVQGDMTLQQFINYFQEKYSLEITMLTYGVCVLFSCFSNATSMKERIELPMTKVVENVSKKVLDPHVKTLLFELCCSDKEGEDVEVPYVRYTIP